MARRALCVGIDTYRLPDRLEEMAGADVALRGSVNDALAWADVFAREYGFDWILVLLDGEATKSAVMGGSSSCSATHSEGDVLAFAFSGHGTYVVDRTSKGDERYDEAMVTHDDLLTDDEFAGLLRRPGLGGAAHRDLGQLLRRRRPRHRGGGHEAAGRGSREGVQAEGIQAEGVQAEGIQAEAPAARRVRAGDARPAASRTGRTRDVASRSTGCARCCSRQPGPGRIAFDDDFDGAPQGVLTHYALRAMDEARYDLTYAQLLSEAPL